MDFWVVGEKFTKFLMSYLEPSVSFSWNFESLFHVMRDKSFVLFKLLKLYMFFTNRDHQSAKSQTFECWGEILPNWYFDRLFLLEVCKISTEKVQRSYVSWYRRVVQNLKKNPIFCFKNEKKLVDFDPSTKKSRKCALWLVPFVQII